MPLTPHLSSGWLPLWSSGWLPLWLAGAAHGLPTSVIIRICLALAILPLLYRLLAEQGQDEWRRDWLRRGAFALAGALVFFFVTNHWLPETGGPDQGRAFEAYARGYLELRVSQCAGESALAGFMGGDTQKFSEDLGTAARLLPQSATFQRTYGVALVTQGRYATALVALDHATTVLAQRAPRRAAAERAVWHRLFDHTKPTAADVAETESRLQEFSLGWIGEVAQLAAYQRIGARAVPTTLKETVSREARAYVVETSVNGLAFLLMIPQFGVVAFLVALALIATGVLRAARQNYHAVSGPLWEAFIVMMALHFVPLERLFGRTLPAPETQPGAVALLLVVGDVLQVVAVLYLWFRLHGRKLPLAEIGLTTRHLGANILIGAGAAVVMIPVEWLLALATQAVSDRFFPNVSPPYHPLQGMTAAANSPLIRFALFFLAAIGAPLIEETFFRGVLFGAIRRRLGFWAGLLWSSAFFAALHPQLPLGFLPIALLGATFCALYEWRQSLVPGMVAHAVNNGLIFLLLGSLFPASG